MNEDNREILKLCKAWFSSISEKCDRLTSGNVSHQSATIKAMSKECIEYIDIYLNRLYYFAISMSTTI